MAWRALIIALVLLALSAAAPAGAGEARPPLVIASVQADLDGDGQAETLEVVLIKGRYFHDAEPWCGAGDKWEGSFALRLLRGERLLDQRPWGELFPRAGQEEAAFFWKPLTLVVADYNGDGRPDCNLGVYGSCNINLYRLYGVDGRGRLVELPLAGGKALAVSGAGRSNSTALIQAAGGVLSHSYYDNSQGREITVRYRWQGGRFVPLAAKP